MVEVMAIPMDFHKILYVYRFSKEVGDLSIGITKSCDNLLLVFTMTIAIRRKLDRKGYDWMQNIR